MNGLQDSKKKIFKDKKYIDMDIYSWRIPNDGSGKKFLPMVGLL